MFLHFPASRKTAANLRNPACNDQNQTADDQRYQPALMHEDVLGRSRRVLGREPECRGTCDSRDQGTKPERVRSWRPQNSQQDTQLHDRGDGKECRVPRA